MPRDFDAIEVPFPERGEPRLVKPRAARHRQTRALATVGARCYASPGVL